MSWTDRPKCLSTHTACGHPCRQQQHVEQKLWESSAQRHSSLVREAARSSKKPKLGEAKKQKLGEGGMAAKPVKDTIRTEQKIHKDERRSGKEKETAFKSLSRPHQRQRSRTCKECGGASICPHHCQRSSCKARSAGVAREHLPPPAREEHV